MRKGKSSVVLRDSIKVPAVPNARTGRVARGYKGKMTRFRGFSTRSPACRPQAGTGRRTNGWRECYEGSEGAWRNTLAVHFPGPPGLGRITHCAAWIRHPSWFLVRSLNQELAFDGFVLVNIAGMGMAPTLWYSPPGCAGPRAAARLSETCPFIVCSPRSRKTCSVHHKSINSSTKDSSASTGPSLPNSPGRPGASTEGYRLRPRGPGHLDQTRDQAGYVRATPLRGGGQYAGAAPGLQSVGRAGPVVPLPKHGHFSGAVPFGGWQLELFDDQMGLRG